jgi:hypothetical protein
MCTLAGLSFEAGCRRNSTSTLYSASSYFLCIKDKKCVIYSQSRFRDNDHVFFFSLPIAYYRHDYWPLNCKQYKPNRQKSHRFSLDRWRFKYERPCNCLCRHYVILLNIFINKTKRSIHFYWIHFINKILMWLIREYLYLWYHLLENQHWNSGYCCWWNVDPKNGAKNPFLKCRSENWVSPIRVPSPNG